MIQAPLASLLLASRVLVLEPGIEPTSRIEDSTETSEDRRTPADGGLVAGPWLTSVTPTGISIGWQTAESIQSVVDHGPTATLGLEVRGTSIPTTGGWIHHVRLEDLEPDTLYWYAVRLPDGRTEARRFRTAAPADATRRVVLVAYSDCQRDDANPRKHREIVDEGILSTLAPDGDPERRIDAVLIPGDLVATGGVPTDWTDDFFAQNARLVRSVPMIPALGNHEQNADLYFDYLDLPTNGTPGFEEHWYETDLGNVRVLTLDTNAPYTNPEQLAWLDERLADAAAADHVDFVIAQFHHPHLSELWTPGESPYSTQIVRRLESFTASSGKPSMHLFGHTHGYSRGQSLEHQHLMVNVASGMGNLDYWYEYPQADYPEFERSDPEWGFCTIESLPGDAPRLRLRRYSRGNEVSSKDNELMDEIEIRGDNLPPSTPEATSPSLADGPVPGDAVEFASSPFDDPDGDALLETHWQIAASADAFAEPIAETWRRSRNWYRPDNGDAWYSVETVEGADITRVELEEALPGCTTLHWRVRHRDGGLKWSAWSEPIAFEVGDSPIGPVPTIPADGAVGVSLRPTLSTGFCEPADSYLLRLGPVDTFDPGTTVASSPTPTFGDLALPPETTFEWRVDAVRDGRIEPGPRRTFTTLGTTPTPNSTEWRFDDDEPADAVAFSPAHGESTLTPQGMVEGVDWEVVIAGEGGVPPLPGGDTTRSIRLRAPSGPGRGLRCEQAAPGNGGGGCCDLHLFTIIWDVRVDENAEGLQALWQGNDQNANDAEFFLDATAGGFHAGPSGRVGGGSWTPGEWVRVVQRVDWDTRRAAIFVNGDLVIGESDLAAPDWFYGAGSGRGCWFLTDDDGEVVDPLDCAAIAFVDRLLSDEEVAALGGPHAGGIFRGPPARADIDGNGRIDGGDLGRLLAAWGPVGPFHAADIDEDGRVNGADLGLVLSGFGRGR